MTWLDIQDQLMSRWSRAWRWALWSPRRAFAVLAVLLLGLAAWGQISGNGSSSPATAGVADETMLPPGWRSWPVVTAKAGQVAPPSVVPSPTVTASPSVQLPPEEAAARRAATVFTQMWAHPERSRRVWLAGVQRYADDNLMRELKTVDPRNIPSIDVLGAEPLNVTRTDGVYLVLTDGPKVRVSVRKFGDKWLATSIDRVGMVPAASPSASA